MLLAGIRQRSGVSLGILLVTMVAVAAAAIGPVYDTAARTSVLTDSLRNSSGIEQSVEGSSSGPVPGLADGLTRQLAGVLAAHLGGESGGMRRLFQSPVQSLSAQVAVGGHQSTLMWRTDACAHVRIVAGTCPAGKGQVLVSTSYARLAGVRPGGTIDVSSGGYGRLAVTGEYAPPPLEQLNSTYWLDGACTVFSYEDPCQPKAPPWDALFTSAATFNAAGPEAQGQAVAWYTLAPGALRPGDLPVVTAAVNEALTDPGLQLANVSVTSSIPQLTGQVTASWGTLDVPVFLVSVQVALLGWLLLFLIATDAAEARAGEIALAKLRGYGPLRTIAFGLSESALLIGAGFLAGTFAGWLAAAGLARVLLRPGTPAGLPALAVAAAAAAALGGLAAVAVAARRVLTRPVTQQWRHAARDGAKRGWTLDAVLLTGAVAGLAELIIGGHVASARSGSLGLLVPGLLGLAAAVVASRVLPAACRLAALFTRRRGGLGAFLAVRHIARRPGGTRTTIALAAAFALAAFAVAAYAVEGGNVNRVAAAQTGADTVLTVQAPAGQDLGAIVDRIDPGGREAAAVDRYSGNSSGSVLLAVQPQRYARVAEWKPGFLSRPAAGLATALTPPAASPVTLPAGSTQVRARVVSEAGLPPGATLTAWVAEQGSPGGGQTPVSLGALRPGPLTAAVTGCPCQVSMVTVDWPSAPAGTTSGSVTLTGLDAESGGSWKPAGSALASSAGWTEGAEDQAGCDGTTGRLEPDLDNGVRWTFTTSGGCNPALRRSDTPAVLPALVSGQLADASQPGTAGTMQTTGLDGNQLAVKPVALAGAVPGAPANGIVVDREYALRAAYFTRASFTAEQVWVAPGALAAVRGRLQSAGVSVTSVTTVAGAEQTLDRQGPALASVLFLAAAVAAALLAAGAAVLGLYQSGRGRRHEYAALLAGGVPRKVLRSAVFYEQATVLGFGAGAGVAAGAGAAALVLRNVPEFPAWPPAPPLVFVPPAAGVLVPLAVIALALAAAVTAATVALVRSVRPELLREEPP